MKPLRSTALSTGVLLALSPCAAFAQSDHQEILTKTTIVGTIPASSLPTTSLVKVGNLSNVPAGQPQHLGSFSIVINPTPALSANPAALAAFNRAAAQWQARISDPITVTIDADLAPLGAGIIGSTGSVALQDDYTSIRNAVALDGADEPSNAAVTAALPSNAVFSANIPGGRSLSANLTLTKANAKALGYTGLDAQFGASDAQMTFSSNFSFDFDKSNGITPGTMDFETVAAHEIGHALGFISAVDDVNAGADPVQATTLDLFRFKRGAPGQDPANLSDFAVVPRDLMPGDDTIFDDTVKEYRFSTGVSNPSFPGTDGNQASHWKADDITGNLIGIMDPTLDFGQTETITDADLRAFDLIGYEVVPEPATLSLLALAAPALLRRRRRA